MTIPEHRAIETSWLYVRDRCHLEGPCRCEMPWPGVLQLVLLVLLDF